METRLSRALSVRSAAIGVLAALLVVLLVALGFLGRVVTEPSPRAAAPAGVATAAAGTAAARAPDASVVGEILKIVQQNFYDASRADPQFLLTGAINGVFTALNDPHSTYIDPDTWAISRSDFAGTFEGIGANVAQQGDYVVIVRPISGTPADRAGLRAGDQILEVDGEDAQGWSVNKAVLRIRGPRGTSVTLRVRHADGTELRAAIVRAEIAQESVVTTPPTGPLKDAAGQDVRDLAYVSIRQFTSRTPQEVSTALKAALQPGVRGLIIDVRSDPGGLLNETVQTADLFLDSGLILTQVDRDGTQRTFRAQAGQVTTVPIVILQDEFSASGSEVFAAALQENGRATVMGTRSLGKGTVNLPFALSNGGAVYVSIGRWLTPAGRQIEGLGVTPDIEVKFTQNDIDAQRDVAVLRAIDVLRSKAR